MKHKYLGWANNWPAVIWRNNAGEVVRVEKEDTTPSEYTACIAAGHKTREVCKGNAWYKVYCDECNISWEYDCSG